MRKKPELLVTAGSVEESIKLIDAGANAINIGGMMYGLRMPGDMNLTEIEQCILASHQRGAKVYVSVNNIMDHNLITQLPEYLIKLHAFQVDAVIFGDPAVIMALNEADLNVPLHWNTEMTSTNYATANYWGKKGAVRVVLARELNLNEVHQVKQNTELEVQVQVHGITNIYHSKRKLIKSYINHLNKKESHDFIKDKLLYLVEHERRELKLPIYEDTNGTHIMSADDVCMIENLDELLEIDLDSLKIEGLLKPIEYNVEVVRCYREALDAFYKDPLHYHFDERWLKRIKEKQDKNRQLTYGFFFKEQVY